MMKTMLGRVARGNVHAFGAKARGATASEARVWRRVRRVRGLIREV
jgi:hypothetical protein